MKITKLNHSTSLSWKSGKENGCMDWKQCVVVVVSFLATAFTLYLVICLFFAQSFTAGFYLTHLTVEAQQDGLSHTSLQDYYQIEEKLFHNIFMAVNTKLLWQSELIREQWIMWLHQQCVRLLYLLLLLAAAVNSAARPQPLSYGSL